MVYKKVVGKSNLNSFFLKNLLKFNFNKFIKASDFNQDLKSLKNYSFLIQYNSLFWVNFINFFKYFFKMNKKILFYYVEVLLSRLIFADFSKKSHHFFLHMWYPGAISNLREIRLKLLWKKNWLPILPDFVFLFSFNPLLMKEVFNKKLPYFLLKNNNYCDSEIVMLQRYYFMLSLFKTIFKISRNNLFKNYFFNFFKKRGVSYYSYEFNNSYKGTNFL